MGPSDNVGLASSWQLLERSRAFGRGKTEKKEVYVVEAEITLCLHPCFKDCIVNGHTVVRLNMGRWLGFLSEIGLTIPRKER
jgi:hypothetical protein